MLAETVDDVSKLVRHVILYEGLLHPAQQHLNQLADNICLLFAEGECVVVVDGYLLVLNAAAGVEEISAHLVEPDPHHGHHLVEVVRPHMVEVLQSQLLNPSAVLF